MSAPDLTVQITGQGAVTGDMLNTYVSGCDNAGELRAFVGVQGVQVFMRGTNAPGDGGEGNFFWNSNSTAPDDNGKTTIVPYGSGSGAWTRLTGTGAGSNAEPGNPPGTTDTSQTMLGLNQVITPESTGRVLCIVSGEVQSTISGDGGNYELFYGSGTPPINGAPTTGTSISSGPGFIAAAANQIVPFSIQGFVVNLSQGTAYWFDLVYRAQTAGTFAIDNVTVTLIEL